VQLTLKAVVLGLVHGVEILGGGGSAVGRERRRSKGNGRHAKGVNLIECKQALHYRAHMAQYV